GARSDPGAPRDRAGAPERCADPAPQDHPRAAARTTQGAVMKKAFIVLALAVVEFAKGFLAALLATGLTSLDASTVQMIVIGALVPAGSVVLTGLDRLRTYLTKENS